MVVRVSFLSTGVRVLILNSVPGFNKFTEILILLAIGTLRTISYKIHTYVRHLCCGNGVAYLVGGCLWKWESVNRNENERAGIVTKKEYTKKKGAREVRESTFIVEDEYQPWAHACHFRFF